MAIFFYLLSFSDIVNYNNKIFIFIYIIYMVFNKKSFRCWQIYARNKLSIYRRFNSEKNENKFISFC